MVSACLSDRLIGIHRSNRSMAPWAIGVIGPRTEKALRHPHNAHKHAACSERKGKGRGEDSGLAREREGAQESRPYRLGGLFSAVNRLNLNRCDEHHTILQHLLRNKKPGGYWPRQAMFLVFINNRKGLFHNNF